MKYVYKLSVSQLCTSLKYRSKEYFRESNLHGISYVVDSTRPKWERVMWFVLTMASVSVTLWIIITIWDKFQKEPTINEIDMLTENIEIDFPQVFLCRDWTHMNYSGLGEIESKVFKKLYNWQWGETFEPVDPAYTQKFHFFRRLEAVVPNCDNFFKYCRFGGQILSCMTNFVKVLTPVGGCCKFNASEPLTTSNTKLTFSFAPLIYPFRLYLMNKMDTVPQRDDKPLEVIHGPMRVEIGVQITYSTPQLRYLTRQQRRCHYNSKTLTVNNCELQCQAERIFKMCKCVPWFLAASERKECYLDQYSCVKLNESNAIDCDCVLPCDHVSYMCEKIVPTDGLFQTCDIKIKTWPNALFKRRIRFGYLQLLVSFSGVASLFLGFSIVSVIEFVYYFTLKIYCGAVVEASCKKCNIVKVFVEPEPRKADVAYYNYID